MFVDVVRRYLESLPADRGPIGSLDCATRSLEGAGCAASALQSRLDARVARARSRAVAIGPRRTLHDFRWTAADAVSGQLADAACRDHLLSGTDASRRLPNAWVTSPRPRSVAHSRSRGSRAGRVAQTARRACPGRAVVERCASGSIPAWRSWRFRPFCPLPHRAARRVHRRRKLFVDSICRRRGDVAHGHRDRRAPRQWRGMGIAGILCLYALPFSFAYTELSAGTGALILFGSVQLTMIATAIADGERPKPIQWLGLGLAVTGLVYLVRPGLTAPPPAAAGLMALAGACWGIEFVARSRCGESARRDNRQLRARRAPVAHREPHRARAFAR